MAMSPKRKRDWDGPGTLTRRGNRWHARIYLGPDFAPQQPSKTFPLAQEAEAKAWLHEMAGKKIRGVIAIEQPGEVLIGELFQHWRDNGWDDRYVGLSDKTQSLYKGWWNRYCVMDRD